MLALVDTQIAFVFHPIHGTRYTDELFMVRVKNKGDLCIHQAERDRRGSVKDWTGVAPDQPRDALGAALRLNAIRRADNCLSLICAVFCIWDALTGQ